MPTIYLIPNFLSDSDVNDVFPEKNIEIIKTIRLFFVENIRTARRFLRKIDKSFPIDDSEFILLDKKTTKEDILEKLDLIEKSGNIGIISESGMPAIADPGAKLVEVAHEKGFKVHPLVGPSSIFLALAASGLNGQRFSFIGYLTNKTSLLAKEIKKIESRSKNLDETVIFIETPYRNVSLINSLLKVCNPQTKLCVAADITGPNQTIETHTISQWKKLFNPKSYHKINTIFLLKA